MHLYWFPYLFCASVIDRFGSSSGELFILSSPSVIILSAILSNPTLFILFAVSSITLVYFHYPFCFTISAAITEGSIVKWWLYSWTYFLVEMNGKAFRILLILHFLSIAKSWVWLFTMLQYLRYTSWVYQQQQQKKSKRMLTQVILEQKLNYFSNYFSMIIIEHDTFTSNKAN